MKTKKYGLLALAALALVGLGTGTTAQAQEVFAARLAGHAIIPAHSFIPAPQDAPASFQVSGRFAADGIHRIDQLNSVEGTTWLGAKGAPRGTGISFPFVGQPLQGFSGIKSMGNGEFIALIDNGFGSKGKSTDTLLTAHHILIDWPQSRARVSKSIFLHDPDKIIPFAIVNEHTDTRYLTGDDFDIESIQPIDGSLWFGDEFGPFLISTDGEGKVTGYYETTIDGRTLRSPDHPAINTPAVPGEVSFEVRRSRGFEGMASSPDGKYLYPLLEGPLWDGEKRQWENENGREYLRILEFDIAAKKFTGRQWKYLLELNGNNIGDFNMISPTRGLIIERDNGEGDPALACKGAPRSDCFNVPARFKRVYLVDFAAAENGFVAKRGYVDLMNIADPNGVALRGAKDGVFTFPFVTIENVDMVDARHIIVANDNNLPFSPGRTIGQADDNEFILLEVGDMLME